MGVVSTDDVPLVVPRRLALRKPRAATPVARALSEPIRAILDPLARGVGLAAPLACHRGVHHTRIIASVPASCRVRVSRQLGARDRRVDAAGGRVARLPADLQDELGGAA